MQAMLREDVPISQINDTKIPAAFSFRVKYNKNMCNLIKDLLLARFI